MHRTIGYLSARLVHIRAGEGRTVLLTFLYFFLVITAYYVIKPVSRSLVLDELGSRLVPYVDLISALLMGPMVALFARFVDRIEKRRLVSLTFWAVAACLVVFWQFLKWPAKWVPAAFYVWVAIFSVLVVTLFWLVANDLYHPREAKRLFGFIGSGGILGGIVGSSIAAAGARIVGTEQLLLLSAAILLVCWMVVQRLWRDAPRATRSERRTTSRRASSLSTMRDFVRLLTSSRYFLLLVGLVGIAKILATLIYYQFNPFIEQMFPDADAKTAFTGLFLGWLNVAAFVIQFFFTSWVLRRLGLACALLLLPLGLLGGSIGLLLVPTFWLAATTELYDGSMNYSLQQTTKEVLYLPIDRSIRYKVKPFIDMVVFRVGKGIAAVLGIVLLDWWHLEARVLSYVSIPLLLVWIALAMQLRHDYVGTIRGLLQARAASRRSRERRVARRLPGAAPEAHQAPLEPKAWHSPPQEKLLLATQLFTTNGTLTEGSEPLLHALAQYEEQPGPQDPWTSAPSLEQLKEWLQDRHESMVVRRAAIRHLVQQDGQEAVDCLLGMLMVEEDAAMRVEFLRGLTKLRLRYPHGLEFPKRIIRRQISKDVEGYQRIAETVMIYRHLSAVPPGDDDPVLGLLRLLMEDLTAQIFRLLSLVYRPDDIYLIYNQLREPDAYIRADAIELLDNLIDPGFRWIIFPVLDENSFLDRADRPLEEPLPDPDAITRLLRQQIWEHNRWLSVVVLGLVGRLRLEALFAEVDQAAQSRIPLLSLAAQAARRLATDPAPT